MAKQIVVEPTPALMQDTLKEWQLFDQTNQGTRKYLAYRFDLTHEEAHALSAGLAPADKFISDKDVAAAVQAGASSAGIICALSGHRGISVAGTFLSGPHMLPLLE